MSRRLLAEFLGTFALVFVGCGSIVSAGPGGGSAAEIGIAITFGGIIAAMIYALGPVSGAHFNPVVSLGLALLGKHPWRQVVPYIASQCIGAIGASGVTYLLYLDKARAVQFGATLPKIGLWQAVLLESIITVVLLTVIFQVALRPETPKSLPGMVIGGTVAVLSFFAGPSTGNSMNPARTLGPAIFGGALDSLWVYIVGPVIGMLIAVYLHRWLERPSLPTSAEL